MTNETSQEPGRERTPEEAARIQPVLEKARNTPRLTMAEYKARRREEDARRARGEKGPTPEQAARLEALMAEQGWKPGDSSFEKIMAIIDRYPPLWETDDEYLAFMASIGRPQKREELE